MFYLNVERKQKLILVSLFSEAHLAPRKCRTEVDTALEVVLALQGATSHVTRILDLGRTALVAASMATVIEGESSIVVTPEVPCPIGAVMWAAG